MVNPSNYRHLETMYEPPGPAARVIVVHRLTGLLINTCYDHQLRSDKALVDLKPAIEQLRSLSDVLHNLYVSMDGKIGTSPLTCNLISQEESPLAQCTTELHRLGTVLEPAALLLNEVAITEILSNLGRIKIALDVGKRAVEDEVNVQEGHVMPVKNVDARYSTHNNAGGDQYIHYYASPKGSFMGKLTSARRCDGRPPSVYSTKGEPFLERELLDRLPRVNEAKYDPARRCLNDTRMAVINEVLDWASGNDAAGTRIFWLHGQAGAGKSTIASSIACSLDDASRRWLGGSFFFSRDVALRSKIAHVISSIAFQLSFLHPTITTGIRQALLDDLDIGHSALSTQFQKLLRNPLRNADVLGRPVVIILDALDECGTEKDRKSLLGVIRDSFPHFPAAVKFFITSRPDADIHTAFSSMGSLIRSFDLSSLQREVIDHDIEIFAEARLKEIAQSYGISSVAWPGKATQEALVRQAAGLFQWMSTACDFIEDDNSDGPEEQLSLILEGCSSPTISSPWKAIDDLYNQVLQQAVSPKTSLSRITDLREVLGAIVVAGNPLSAACLSGLLNIQPTTYATLTMPVIQRLRKLRSVLAIPDHEDEVIRIIHPSFTEFLTNPLRCTDLRFFVNATVHHHNLAMGCFNVMQKYLRHDICNLGSMPKSNRHIPDLDKRVTRFVPQELQYACQFWAIHLRQSHTEDRDLYSRVHQFVYEHLIHWIEILSLIGMVDGSILSLELAEDWIMKSSQRNHIIDELQILVQDGQRFIREFQKPLVASSGQVYMSVLPLCPRYTHLSKTFGAHRAGQIRVLVGARESWSPCIATLEGHRGSVETLSCSPDGYFLASAADDSTLCTWNLRTGTPAGMPSQSINPVASMAYSEDGRHIVAGYKDSRIRVWNTQTWDEVAGPSQSVTLAQSCHSPTHVIWLSRHINDIITDERAHSHCINTKSTHLSFEQGQLIRDAANHPCSRTYGGEESASLIYLCGTYTVVAFSIAGEFCVIAGDDFKLRIWNTQTGAQVVPVLAGHTNRISDATFSHDGTRLVSSSLDKSVRIWDITSGENTVIIEDFNQRVAFSNDGKFVVSGAVDWTVRVWDANSGEMVGSPLAGHIAGICSVTFSPDDRLVISGSDDGNVRLWDWQCGFTSTVDQITPNQSSGIIHVKFSTSGSRALSVSRSQHVCVLDTTTGAAIGDPFSVKSQGEPHVIHAIHFSEDAKHIIVVVDNEMQVWEVDSQTLIRGVSLNGCGTVKSLAFCPAKNTVAIYRQGNPHVYIHNWWSGFAFTIKIPMTGRYKPRELLLAFTADEELVVSAMQNGVLEVLDLTQLTILGVKVADPYNINTSDLSRILVSKRTRQGLVQKIAVSGWSANSAMENPESAAEKSFWAVPTRYIIVDMQDYGHPNDLHIYDGWIRGPDCRNLFWLPVESRERNSLEERSIPYAVSASANQMLLGGQRLTFLDFSDVEDEQSRPIFHFLNTLPAVGYIDIGVIVQLQL